MASQTSLSWFLYVPKEAYNYFYAFCLIIHSYEVKNLKMCLSDEDVLRHGNNFSLTGHLEYRVNSYSEVWDAFFDLDYKHVSP